MPQHIMIDLETFGLGPTAAIVQIGAIKFDIRNGIVDSAESGFQATVSLQSSLLAGMTIDQGTIDWWRKCNDRAKASICGAYDSLMSLAEALTSFVVWSNRDETDGIWSHGAAFDIPILEHAYKLLALSPPWGYRSVKDTRTLLWVAKNLYGFEPERSETAHTALADAIAQAKFICQAYKVILSNIHV